MLTIWHNPRCSKSRQTLALIEASNLPFTIRRYLEDHPNQDEIGSIIAQIGLSDPKMMMRKGETRFKELGLKAVSDVEALVQAMAENPILIERPIVTNGSKAIIGRPPEAIKPLLQ